MAVVYGCTLVATTKINHNSYARCQHSQNPRTPQTFYEWRKAQFAISISFFFSRDTQPKNQLGFKWVRFQHHHTSCSRVSWHVKMQTFFLIWTVFPCMQGILRCPNWGKGLEYTVYTYQEFLTFRQCTELKYEVFGAHLIQLQLTGSLSKWSDFTPGGIRRLIWFNHHCKDFWGPVQPIFFLHHLW